MRPHEKRTENRDSDIARVSEEIASRLRGRGIAVFGSDSPDELVQILEAVEEFEGVVQAHGGDLMVDEPPVGGASQPDDSRFLLPTRSDDESIRSYLKRIAQATAAARGV